MSRTPKIDPVLLASYTSQNGGTLVSLSAEGPQFVVFLRHFGCTFCREMVAELASQRSEIEAAGSRLAFIHLGTEEKAKKFFAYYKLDDVPRFSDPEARLYQAFGLVRAELRQYLNFESLYRTLIAWSHGHFVGQPAGDVKRMPGVFLLQNSEIRKSFRHDLVSDRPDYLALATPA
jgi:peroxiredoxin